MPGKRIRRPLGRMRIVSARITAMPRPLPEGILDPMPEVWATLEDGSEMLLYSYYPDEISFREEEFPGLTVDEAIKLKYDKDQRYLRS